MIILLLVLKITDGGDYSRDGLERIVVQDFWVLLVISSVMNVDPKNPLQLAFPTLVRPDRQRRPRYCCSSPENLFAMII